MALEQGLVFGPAVIMGLILGFYEAHLVKADEHGIKGAMGHSLHTIPTTMILVFVAMNIPFMLQFLPNVAFFKSAAFPHVLRAIIGIFAAGKLHALSALAKGVNGMSERWVHCFLIAGLIVASPYLWEMVLSKVVPDSVMKFLVFGGK